MSGVVLFIIKEAESMLRIFVRDYIFRIAKLVFVFGFYFCGAYFFADTGDPLLSFWWGGVVMLGTIAIANVFNF